MRTILVLHASWAFEAAFEHVQGDSFGDLNEQVEGRQLPRFLAS